LARLKNDTVDAAPQQPPTRKALGWETPAERLSQLPVAWSTDHVSP
jgi:hypothetical protein